VNTLRGPRNIVLHRGPDPHREEEGKLGELLPIVDPLHISEKAETRDKKFCVHIEGWAGPTEKAQKYVIARWGWAT